MTTFYSRITESVEDLLAKSHYIVAKCQVDGNFTFDGHHKTVEEIDNESRCRSLCLRIERALESCREEEIPALLEMYDLLHRIGYGKMPDQRFIALQRQRVYAAWKAGNRNIQESQIYSLLKKSTNGHTLRTKMLKNWVRTLVAHNHFPNVTTHESYQRLAIIMRRNIEIELKREWYYANKIDEFFEVGIPVLKSYRCFVNALFPAIITYKQQQALDVHIVEALLSRPDLDPYDQKSLTLELSLVD